MQSRRAPVSEYYAIYGSAGQFAARNSATGAEGAAPETATDFKKESGVGAAGGAATSGALGGEGTSRQVRHTSNMRSVSPGSFPSSASEEGPLEERCESAPQRHPVDPALDFIASQ